MQLAVLECCEFHAFHDECLCACVAWEQLQDARCPTLQLHVRSAHILVRCIVLWKDWGGRVSQGRGMKLTPGIIGIATHTASLCHCYEMDLQCECMVFISCQWCVRHTYVHVHVCMTPCSKSEIWHHQFCELILATLLAVPDSTLHLVQHVTVDLVFHRCWCWCQFVFGLYTCLSIPPLVCNAVHSVV